MGDGGLQKILNRACYQSYVTRRFKRRFGLTPQQYRKKRPPDISEKQLILDISRAHDD